MNLRFMLYNDGVRRKLAAVHRVEGDEGCRYFRSKDEKCPVCLESLRAGGITLKCNHSFHSVCVDSWWRKNRNCPVCRCDHSVQCISEYTSGYTSDNENLT